MNPKVDDGNEMILLLFPLPLVKYRLRGGGGWDGYDLLQRAQRLFTSHHPDRDFLPKIWLINKPVESQFRPKQSVDHQVTSASIRPEGFTENALLLEA